MPEKLRMPVIVWVLSVLGLAPFILCGLAALGHNPDPADRGLALLIDYGAVLLAFAGAVHWGLALAAVTPDPAVQRLRFGLGILPMLLGWIALILAQAIAPWLALAVLIAGLIATLGVEHHASRRNLLPRPYLLMRWGFSVIAVAMLVTVLTLRLLGQTI